MSRVPDFEEAYIEETKNDNLKFEVAAEYTAEAYFRGMKEGRRKALFVIQEAKKQLRKEASQTNGPTYIKTLNWLNAIEEKI